MSQIDSIKPNRIFLPANFKLHTWDDVGVFFKALITQDIKSKEEFETWIKKRSELEFFLSENMAWRYINMTCDTTNADFKNAFDFFVQEIQPHLATISDKLNKKSIEEFAKFPLEGSAYHIMFRSIQKAIELYRDENVEIETQIQIKQAEYQSIIGAMTIQYDDEELTMPKAGSFLQNVDGKVREEIWKNMSSRRLQDSQKLNELFSELVALRHKIAINAGFDNFRDYMFAAMGRFDYSPQDCFDFHKAVADTVVPITRDLYLKRKESLKLSTLRPWDLSVDPALLSPLKPFSTAAELLDKTELCFEKMGPALKEKITQMRTLGHFDLETRKGKAPGGYNYPLEETGIPFIFMNATDTLRDLVTMVHEGGHALHSFAVRDLAVNSFRNPPMEVAELASMSMELISMEYWDVFFEDSKNLKRAKLQHLNDVLLALPWIMAVDKFQHWIYENPSHTVLERQNKWFEVYSSFSDGIVDWSGFEKELGSLWQKQLHIFEVPFYYIEYGMAQLGAISIWKNYKENNSLESYLKFMELGYTKNIKEIYETAGIKFDFSGAYIAELMQFVSEEIRILNET